MYFSVGVVYLVDKGGASRRRRRFLEESYSKSSRKSSIMEPVISFRGFVVPKSCAFDNPALRNSQYFLSSYQPVQKVTKMKIASVTGSGTI